MKSRTKLLVAIIGASATIIAAVITGIFAVRVAKINNPNEPSNLTFMAMPDFSALSISAYENPSLKRGMVYIEHQEFEKALEYFELAASEYDANSLDQALSLMCIGYAYFHLYNFDKAIDYVLDALTIYLSNDETEQIEIAHTCIILGRTFLIAGRFDEAVLPFLRAYSIYRLLDENSYEDECVFSLLMLYMTINNGGSTDWIDDYNIDDYENWPESLAFADWVAKQLKKYNLTT